MRLARFSINSSNRGENLNVIIDEEENKAEQLEATSKAPEDKEVEVLPRRNKKKKLTNLTFEMTLLTNSQVTSNATANFKDYGVNAAFDSSPSSSSQGVESPKNVKPLGVAR